MLPSRTPVAGEILRRRYPDCGSRHRVWSSRRDTGLAAAEAVAPAAGSSGDSYFLSAGLSAEALAAMGFGVGTVGIMMCAYFVPFHITQGPPFQGSVGSASS